MAGAGVCAVSNAQEKDEQDTYGQTCFHGGSEDKNLLGGKFISRVRRSTAGPQAIRGEEAVGNFG